MKYYAIIVAGGSGSRMQTEIPKQFLLLNKLPVLMHTIKAFAESQTNPEILVVLNGNQHQYWADLCREFNFIIPHTVIAGGKERFHSVQNAINSLSGDAFVAIHDAVRPLIKPELIDFCYEKAVTLKNVVVATPSNDSVRQLINGKTTALRRNEIFMVQTPQTFALSVLKEAYNQEYESFFTDDASVVEKMGYSINLIEGDASNLKITYQTDLKIAEAILNSRS